MCESLSNLVTLLYLLSAFVTNYPSIISLKLLAAVSADYLDYLFCMLPVGIDTATLIAVFAEKSIRLVLSLPRVPYALAFNWFQSLFPSALSALLWTLDR